MAQVKNHEKRFECEDIQIPLRPNPTIAEWTCTEGSGSRKGRTESKIGRGIEIERRKEKVKIGKKIVRIVEREPKVSKQRGLSPFRLVTDTYV